MPSLSPTPHGVVERSAEPSVPRAEDYAAQLKAAADAARQFATFTSELRAAINYRPFKIRVGSATKGLVLAGDCFLDSLIAQNSGSIQLLDTAQGIGSNGSSEPIFLQISTTPTNVITNLGLWFGEGVCVVNAAVDFILCGRVRR